MVYARSMQNAAEVLYVCDTCNDAIWSRPGQVHYCEGVFPQCLGTPSLMHVGSEIDHLEGVNARREQEPCSN